MIKQKIDLDELAKSLNIKADHLSTKINSDLKVLSPDWVKDSIKALKLQSYSKKYTLETEKKKQKDAKSTDKDMSEGASKKESKKRGLKDISVAQEGEGTKKEQ